MKRTSRIFFILLTLLMGFVFEGKAQVEAMANYVFSSDSLVGFDEPAASAGALANACFGREFKVYMYRAKRVYLQQKYHLKSAPAVPLTLFKNQGYSNRTMNTSGACDDEDFEAITSQINYPNPVQGWTLASGSNSNSCQPPQLNANNHYTVFTAPTIDAITGLQVASYFDAASAVIPAGHSFIRLNNDSAGAKASSLTKSFIVTPTNALFEYAYLPVIQDGGHACCDQPGFNIHITITNTTTNASTLLACPQISIAVPGAACQFTPPPGSPVFTATPANNGWSYHDWSASAIDLTAYLGSRVTIDVVVVDCTAGGHAAYSYFDAKCAPMTIIGNNSPFPAGTPSVNLPTCGATSATICAPDGLGPYSWDGPGVVAPYNVPANSNQCYTTAISSQYTLSMNPPGSCNPITRIITVTITPAPFILASAVQAVCGGTVASISYTAAGSASVNPTVIWSPAPTGTTGTMTHGIGTFPPGTGVVTLTVLDALGCAASTTANINTVPPQPTVGIINVTGSPSITCITPSVILSGVSGYTYGTLSYFWSASSFTSSSQTISVTAASPTITLNATDPVSGCAATATAAVAINITPPTSSVSPISQNINCAAGAIATATGVAISPTTNVTHMWYSPCAPTNPSSSGGQTSIFSPCITGSNGTNTFVLVNNINGCSTAKTITLTSTGGSFPTFSLVSSQNYSIGCTSRSLTNVQITQANADSGAVVSFTILPPGYSGGTTYSTSTSINVYSITTPGTYTVIVKNNNNHCETRIPVSIIQNTFAPDIQVSTLTRTLSCFTPSIMLLGSSANASISTVTYTWSYQNGVNPGNVLSSSLAVNVNTAVPSNTLINTYTIAVYDQNNACTNTSVVPLYQNTNPPHPAIGVQSNIITCTTPSINLTNASASGVLVPPFTNFQAQRGLYWRGPTPQLPDSNKSTYAAFTPGTYTMTTQDLNNGCTAVTTTLILDGRIYPVLSTNTNVALDCDVATTGGVKLAVSAQSLSAGQVTALWTLPQPPPNTNGVGSLTLTTDGVGEYKLTVTTNSNGCSRSIFVEVFPGALTASFTPDKETGFAPLTVNFTNHSSSTSTVNGTASVTSVWSFGNGTSRTTTTNINTSAVYTAPGTYSVTMFTSKGQCRDTLVKVITVDIPSKLVVPNVFTPNGDNSNDIFFVQAANLTQINAQIFDRWGNLIYNISSATGNISWDGKNQSGHEAPDGTYFYTIKATGKDGASYDTKGTVSLYR